MELEANTYTHFFVTFGIFVMPAETLKKCHDSITPGGFVGITTWQKLPWYPMVVKALERLPTPPSHIPTEAELIAMFFAKRPWQDPAYVRKELEDAGFEKVDVVVEEKDADSGTAEQFADTMGKPLEMIGMFWPEEGRKELVEGAKKEFLNVAREEIGDAGSLTLKFRGIVGSGFKKA